MISTVVSGWGQELREGRTQDGLGRMFDGGDPDVASRLVPELAQIGDALIEPDGIGESVCTSRSRPGSAQRCAWCGREGASKTRFEPAYDLAERGLGQAELAYRAGEVALLATTTKAVRSAISSRRIF
jgi:hypothetical protein